MHTDQINHDPAHTVMNTGTAISRPAEHGVVGHLRPGQRERRPARLRRDDQRRRRPQPAADLARGSGTAASCPAEYQGVEFHSSGDPVHYLSNPPGVDRARQRDVVDAVGELEPASATRRSTTPRSRPASRQYEMAFRMQTSVPELMDISDEPAETLDTVRRRPGPTARSPPTACWPAGWPSAACGSSSSTTATGTTTATWSHYMTHLLPARPTAPRAALITDLKQRGMLDDTLVIWGGEFGRTPMFQGKGKDPGRDHHMRASRMWLAGGGIKGGIDLRRDRRARLPRRREPRPRPRPARHDPAPAGHRPRAADLPLPGPRLPPDRRERHRGETDPRLNRRLHPETLMMAPRRLSTSTSIAIALALGCTATASAQPPRLEFTRMVAHWAEYADPDYLAFIEEAKPEIAQVGFYGGHFWSLAHTPHGKGYPAHFPVQGWPSAASGSRTSTPSCIAAGSRSSAISTSSSWSAIPTARRARAASSSSTATSGTRRSSARSRSPTRSTLLAEERRRQADRPRHLQHRRHEGILGLPEQPALAGRAEGLGEGRRRAAASTGSSPTTSIATTASARTASRASSDYLGERFTAGPVARAVRHRRPGGTTSSRRSSAGTTRRNRRRCGARCCGSRRSRNKQAFDEVFVEYGRSLKPDLIAAQWNHLGDFSQINGDERCLLARRAVGPGRGLSLVQHRRPRPTSPTWPKGILGEGTLQARYIRGAFDDKPFTLGKYESTRIRVAIAELAANGGAPMGFYTAFKDDMARREIVRYYGFLRRYDDLYRANRPHAEVVLLYPAPEVHEGDIEAVEAFKQLGRGLLDDHVLFDVLPDDLATPERLAGYRKAVEISQGEKPAISPSELSRFEAPKTVRVSASRPVAGGELTVHFVNYNRQEPKEPRSARLGDRRREAARGRGDQGRSPPAPRDPCIGRAGDVTREPGARGAADRDGRRAGPVRDARVPGLRRGPGETG